LRCFFFAIRLRRFLMTEPMNYLSTTETSTSLGTAANTPGSPDNPGTLPVAAGPARLGAAAGAGRAR